MPTKYTRRSTRGSWSEDNLVEAVNAVKHKVMGINAAAKYFKIPMSTLKRRVRTDNISKGRLGPSSLLGEENEKKIILHIKKLQERGFTPSRNCLRSIAFSLAEKLIIKHNFDAESKKAGYDWLNSFLARNPKCSVRKSEGVSKNRALGMNKEVVKKYFALLENTLRENDLVNKPGHIFNVDETGLQLNNKPGDVIAMKGSKNVNTVTSGEKGETISVVCCFSAEGQYIPPYCIFKGKNKKEEFVDGMPSGSFVVMNEKSAYINSELFFYWLKNHFFPRKPVGKVVLILDGHTSHCSLVEMLEFAEMNDIILLSLPSHTSHYLQPLDRSFFKSLKSNFNVATNSYMVNNPTRQITRLQFGKLLGSAWAKSATIQTALSGFKATGIKPLNINAIPEYAYLTPPNDIDQDHVTDALQPAEKNSEECIPPHTEEPASVPGTSTGGETHYGKNHTQQTPVKPRKEKDILTPSKLLHEISPVPIVQKKITKRSITASVPKVVNSRENIEKIINAQNEKKKIKEEKAKKRSSSALNCRSRHKQSKLQLMYDDDSDTDDNDQWNENECVGCGEDYVTTVSKEDWLQCITCKRWMHENCTKHVNECDLCVKMQIKINKRLLKIKKERA